LFLTLEVSLVGRKDPLQELLNIQERINRLFEESLGRAGRGATGFGDSGGWIPLADVYETPETFVVLLELPGLDGDDVEVDAADNILTVKGERRLSGSTRPESFYRMERSYGSFSRSFRFNEAIDTTGVTAHFQDGLLKLDLPKLQSRSDWRSRTERS
jgi:HSP20 family protein